MEELVIGDKTYIPSKKAAEITGYAKDYIGQLCREGRVEAKLVGRSWYVLETSIREHRFGSEAPLKAENADPEKPPVIAKEEPTETWESPTYVNEPLEEVLPKLQTTYVENKPQIEEPTIADLQQSWESWFSRPQAEAVVEEDAVVPVPEVEAEEAVDEPEPVVSLVETVDAVPLRRVAAERPMGAQMDIAPAPRIESSVASPYAGNVSTSSRRPKARKGSGLVMKSLFVAFVVVVAAVSVIGTGFFESISENTQFAAPIIDFIGGVERTSK